MVLSGYLHVLPCLGAFLIVTFLAALHVQYGMMSMSDFGSKIFISNSSNGFLACPTEAPVSRERILVATMLTEGIDQYSKGSVKLIASAKRRLKTPVTFGLLELVEKPIPDEYRTRLADAGWTFINVTRVPPRDEGGTNHQFKDQFTKLHLWAMEEYDRVIYIDSDCFVLGSLEPLINLDMDRDSMGNRIDVKLWVSRDIDMAVAGHWISTFNMGVFMMRPNKTEYERLLRLKDDPTVQFQTIMAEQGFLNEVYKGQWGDFGTINNGMNSVAEWENAYWNTIWPTVNIIHYTILKPWHCGRDPMYCRVWVDFKVPSWPEI